MKKVRKYIKESFGELNKVTWPTKNQAIKLTMIVIGVCAAIGVFLVLVDYVFGVLRDLYISNVNS